MRSPNKVDSGRVHCKVWGLGFRVWGFGFGGFSGLGSCKVWGLRLRVRVY